MKTLIVICALFAIVTAHHECGPLQKLKVKQQWSAAFGNAKHRTDFGTALWRSIFSQAPQAIDKFFTRVQAHDIKSGMFQAHSMRVLGALNMVISAMDDDAVAHNLLEHLRDDHKEMGVPASYFKVFKKSLLSVVPVALGRCFDRDAWDACFDDIADHITDY